MSVTVSNNSSSSSRSGTIKVESSGASGSPQNISISQAGSGGNDIVLSNGVAVTGLSGSQSSEKYYKINVPSSQSSLEIKIYGGSGDCDLYVKKGQRPTTSNWDYRPYIGGNNETVTVSNPSNGWWYIMLRGYSSYSGVSLKATYGGGGSCTLSISNNNIPSTVPSSGGNYSFKVNLSGSCSGWSITSKPSWITRSEEHTSELQSH